MISILDINNSFPKIINNILNVPYIELESINAHKVPIKIFVINFFIVKLIVL